MSIIVLYYNYVIIFIGQKSNNITHPDYVPSLFAYTSGGHAEQHQNAERLERYSRTVSRNTAAIVALNATPNDQIVEPEDHVDNMSSPSAVEDDLLMGPSSCTSCENLKKDLDIERKKKEMIEQSIKSDYIELEKFSTLNDKCMKLNV